jgi:hypothetical protein
MVGMVTAWLDVFDNNSIGQAIKHCSTTIY